MKTADEILKMVNEFLDHLSYDRKPESLYEPIKYVLSMGGKRIRPTLMLLAYNLYKENPEDILVLIYERIREDYWRGWYRRHSWTVRMKLREWHETAYRRFVDPEEGQRLIEIFFQSLDGTYKGPRIISR